MAFAAASAQAEPLQFTAHGDLACVMYGPSPNSAADLVAFESTCDLTGGNADRNREIFQVDDQGQVTQLTDTALCGNASPSSNAAGDVIAFDSDCDFDGGNADGSVEIFIVGDQGVTQLTGGQLCSSLAPSSNAAGTLVAFDSDCDFFGTNIERSNEIFQATSGGQVVQLTSDTSADGCGSFNAASNAVGDLVAFESDCDLTGQNEEEIAEIFQVSSAAIVDQLTVSQDDACLSTTPASDAAGDLVAFESDCDFLGTNSDGGIEIYTVTSAASLAQVSDASGAACESVMPFVSADGTKIAYTSYCDPFGDNTDGSFELFAGDANGVEQLTDGTSCSSLAPALSADGELAVYLSDCDAAANGDGSDEIFQASAASCGVCGVPVSGNPPGEPSAVDALFTLQAAIGLQVCLLCTCDVDSNEIVAATDALRILHVAVGLGVELSCPDLR